MSIPRRPAVRALTVAASVALALSLPGGPAQASASGHVTADASRTVTTTAAPALSAAPVAAPVVTAAPQSGVRVAASSRRTGLYRSSGKLLKFHMVTGRSSWIPAAKKRIKKAHWNFKKSHEFVFSTVDVRTDLFPLHGTWKRHGKRYYFSAHAYSVIGASVTFTEMQGYIDFSKKKPVLSVSWATGAGYGAVINGQKFGSTASSCYTAKLRVRH